LNGLLRGWLVFVALALGPWASAQTTQVVTVDGVEVKALVGYVEPEAVSVPADPLAAALWRGGAVQVAGKTITVVVAGVPLATGAVGTDRLVVLREPKRTLQLDSAIRLRSGRVYMGVGDLASLANAFLDQRSFQLHIKTPESYARLLGVTGGREVGLNERIAGRAIDLGISPAAANIVVWTRPDRDQSVQLYCLTEAETRPQGILAEDGRVAEARYDEAANWTPAKRLVRVLRQSDLPEGSRMVYGAAFVGAEVTDPIAAINEGKGGDWAIAGVETFKRAESGIRFDIVTLPKTFSSWAALAEFLNQTPEVLMAINGASGTDRELLAAGRKVVKMVASLARPVAESVLAPYVVKAGDTVTSICDRFAIDEPSLRLYNGELEGPNLSPNDIVWVPKSSDSSLTAKALTGPYRLRKTTLFAGSDGRMQVVTTKDLLYNVVALDSARGLATFDSATRVLDLADLVSATVPGGEPVFTLGAKGLRASAADRVAQTALSFVGADSAWGQAKLHRAGDTTSAHFVAEVLRQANVAAVRSATPGGNGEDMVHWRPGPAFVGEVVKVLGPCDRPITSLRRGDQVYIQYDLTLPPTAAANRRTGLYLGPMSFRGKFIPDAVTCASSKSVECVSLRMFRAYRFSRRNELRLIGGKP
jgi:hypothetical protein